MYLSMIFILCSKQIIISLDAVRNQTSNRKYLQELIKRRSKVHQKYMSGFHLKFRSAKSIFQKLQSSRTFCSQNYQEQLSLAIFCRVYSNSKKVSYLNWHNKYCKWKSTCRRKAKIFLWTKYLISVAANLTAFSR